MNCPEKAVVTASLLKFKPQGPGRLHESSNSQNFQKKILGTRLCLVVKLESNPVGETVLFPHFAGCFTLGRRVSRLISAAEPPSGGSAEAQKGHQGTPEKFFFPQNGFEAQALGVETNQPPSALNAPPFLVRRGRGASSDFFRCSHTGYRRAPNHFSGPVRSASEVKIALPRRGLFNIELGQ